MPLHDYLPLMLFVIVSTVTPGGATTLATASGAHFGYRRSLPMMAGIAAGLASMAAAAAAGLGSVLLALPTLQLAMKAVGSPDSGAPARPEQRASNSGQSSRSSAGDRPNRAKPTARPSASLDDLQAKFQKPRKPRKRR